MASNLVSLFVHSNSKGKYMSCGAQWIATGSPLGEHDFVWKYVQDPSQSMGYILAVKLLLGYIIGSLKSSRPIKGPITVQTDIAYVHEWFSILLPYCRESGQWVIPQGEDYYSYKPMLEPQLAEFKAIGFILSAHPEIDLNFKKVNSKAHGMPSHDLIHDLVTGTGWSNPKRERDLKPHDRVERQRQAFKSIYMELSKSSDPDLKRLAQNALELARRTSERCRYFCPIPATSSPTKNKSPHARVQNSSSNPTSHTQLPKTSSTSPSKQPTKQASPRTQTPEPSRARSSKHASSSSAKSETSFTSSPGVVIIQRTSVKKVMAAPPSISLRPISRDKCAQLQASVVERAESPPAAASSTRQQMPTEVTPLPKPPSFQLDIPPVKYMKNGVLSVLPRSLPSRIRRKPWAGDCYEEPDVEG
ncbi:hypothetical protein CYLTODRAFT_490938 [Cylindrobasidium torrendii FP15055 ss-10]|uniref:Uncharacterized protein n=1 Tax=Cylindrobasidium torrendii FP15055 ss-10 TaxID=1314674 RepID=A0A0D7B936_9AGAR|nr:hypothetical protein CYLTODRAFT_490938 [Cylindrobasidium torrendii FP15055 ss-10]